MYLHRLRFVFVHRPHSDGEAAGAGWPGPRDPGETIIGVTLSMGPTSLGSGPGFLPLWVVASLPQSPFPSSDFHLLFWPLGILHLGVPPKQTACAFTLSSCGTLEQVPKGSRLYHQWRRHQSSCALPGLLRASCTQRAYGHLQGAPSTARDACPRFAGVLPPAPTPHPRLPSVSALPAPPTAATVPHPALRVLILVFRRPPERKSLYSFPRGPPSPHVEAFLEACLDIPALLKQACRSEWH